MTEPVAPAEKPRPWRRWIGTTLGGGFLVAFLWDFIVRPLLHVINQGIFAILTVVSHGFIDSIYIQAARRPHDFVGLATFGMTAMIAFIVLSAFLTVSFGMFKARRELDREQEETERNRVTEVDAAVSEESSIAEKLDDLRALVKSWKAEKAVSWDRTKRLGKLSQRLMLGSAVMFTAFLMASALQWFTLSLTAAAISDFDHQIAIHAPEHSPQELLLFQSRFARMRSRDDFVKLMADISSSASSTRP